MSFWGKLIPVLVAAISLVAANGCSPADSTQDDEEKEPHFVLGNSRFNGMDYGGAIEAFQQSLEVNPHSAQAHYRLAQLFDTKQPDPAAAIYHYQEYLRLDPSAENADVIRQRILTCKQQLAADVMSMPTTPQTMRQMEQLTDTNRLLQAEVARLNDSVNQWSSYAASLSAARNSIPPPNAAYPAPPPDNTLVPDNVTPPAAPPRRTITDSKPVATHSRTHVVTAGETLASIARRQGVSLTAVEAANPDVSPKKLRVGQTLNLP